MKIVYIAGPFSASNAFEHARNVFEAEELGLVCVQAGCMPFIPHANTRHFIGTAPEDFFYKATLEMLMRCDAIALTKRWAQSKGARAEREQAMKLGMRVFDFAWPDDLLPSVYAGLLQWVAEPCSPRVGKLVHHG